MKFPFQVILGRTMSKGSDIGGHSVVRDPGFFGRIARKVRKTKQIERHRTRERECFEAELKAYKSAKRRSVLIKRKED